MNKSHLAMFALAAFALGGMLSVPAFAATNTITQEVEGPSSGINSHQETYTSACGTSSTTATIKSSVSNNLDGQTADWDVNCGVVFDDITVEVWKNNSARSGSPDASFGPSTDDDHLVGWSLSVSAGDDFIFDYIIDY